MRDVSKKMKEQLANKEDDNIFNALVKKIESLQPTHFVFVLRNEMMVEEKYLL